MTKSKRFVTIKAGHRVVPGRYEVVKNLGVSGSGTRELVVRLPGPHYAEASISVDPNHPLEHSVQ